MDSTHVPRPSLPPIHALDMDKYQDKYHREELERRSDVSAPAPSTTTVSASPYPSGPPPPYSAASHAPLTATANGYHSEHRPHALDDRDAIRPQQSKQSLPSLHEALGVEQSTPATTTSTSEPARMAAEVPHAGLYAPVGPSAPAPPSHTSYSRSQHGSISYERRLSDNETTSFGRHYAQRSPAAAASQPQDSYPYSPTQARRTFDRAPQAAPASQSFSFGYTSYPPRFPSTAPLAPTLGPTASSAPIFRPSVSHPPPPSSAATQPAWRPEMGSSHPSAIPEAAVAAAYGESVKRHLDMYDFELALNEILEHSTIMCDFSRQYGARLHQNARSAPAPGTLPAITEVEDLMNKSRYTLEALGRMREVLIAQEAAYLQQAQEQRFQSEAEAKRTDSVLVPEEGKGGFAGPEPKKRRGRAAAPGRCHSCNRAETPEWRRGPDGARTLCNACGLHYAKLTRKAGANKAATGGSNLRPKSSERDVAESQ